MNSDKEGLSNYHFVKQKSTIKYRLVSSVKRCIVDLISFKMRNKSGPNIEP